MSPTALALARLKAERAAWRKQHPPGFSAKPVARDDGTQDIMTWHATITAKPDSIWRDASIPLVLFFDDDHPNKPPVVQFLKVDNEPLFHPNVFRDGKVCLSIINPENSKHAYGTGGTWHSNITVPQILVSLQSFLDNPESFAAGREDVHRLYRMDRNEYEKHVRKQVEKLKHNSHVPSPP